jgi:hypothetical protein
LKGTVASAVETIRAMEVKSPIRDAENEDDDDDWGSGWLGGAEPSHAENEDDDDDLGSGWPGDVASATHAVEAVSVADVNSPAVKRKSNIIRAWGSIEQRKETREAFRTTLAASTSYVFIIYIG